MAASAMVTISAASTGPRCAGRAAAGRARGSGGVGAAIPRQLNRLRRAGAPGAPWPGGHAKRHNVAMAASVAPPVPTGSWPLLSVHGLAARFGPLRALDHVDLCLRPGELV